MKNKITAVLIFLCFFYGFSVEAQRKVEDFNSDWKFFQPRNDTYSLDFPNGKDLKLGRIDLWEEVKLPHTFNQEDMQVDRNFYTGSVVYQKTITPSETDKDRRTFLKFEGVGSVAKVYVNDVFIGEHKGAYSQFAFEITHSLKYGEENTISVVANNQAREDVIPVNQFLFPIYGGIYRPVSLITTDKTQFTVTDYASPGIFISQKNVSEDKADIEVKAKLNTLEKHLQDVTLLTTIYDDSGKEIASQEDQVSISPQGTTYLNQNIKVDKPRLWDGVNDPYLYRLSSRI